MIDDAISELKDAIAKATDALKRDLSKLRTGRASPDMLESLRVDYYGSPTPINQMASVTVPEARLLVIKPWDRSTISMIERAIQQSPLELNPQNDGEIIRLPIPALTEDRRRDIVKLGKDHAEKCKVAIRAARHEAKDILETLKKEGEAGEDEIDRAIKKLEQIVQEASANADAIIGRKEKELMEL